MKIDGYGKTLIEIILDTVQRTVSHIGFWIVVVSILLFLFYITRYISMISNNEIFKVINTDLLKILSYLRVIIGTYIISQIFKKHK